MEVIFENVINLKVAVGQSVVQEEQIPDPGQIVGVKVFHNGTETNPGLINLSILGNNKQELSKLQHIENYRDRDSSYMDCKPLSYTGGQKVYIRIEATEVFTQEFNAQVILIYKAARTNYEENC